MKAEDASSETGLIRGWWKCATRTGDKILHNANGNEYRNLETGEDLMDDADGVTNGVNKAYVLERMRVFRRLLPFCLARFSPTTIILSFCAFN